MRRLRRDILRDHPVAVDPLRVLPEEANGDLRAADDPGRGRASRPPDPADRRGGSQVLDVRTQVREEGRSDRARVGEARRYRAKLREELQGQGVQQLGRPGRTHRPRARGDGRRGRGRVGGGDGADRGGEGGGDVGGGGRRQRRRRPRRRRRRRRRRPEHVRWRH